MFGAVDAVSIAVPPDAQPYFAVAAARAGKHILLEKPIATTLQDGRDVVSAIKLAGVQSQVFFTHRHAPEYSDFVKGARSHFCYGANVFLHSDAMSSESPYSASEWRKSEFAALWDLGPHAIAVLLDVLGPILSVQASIDRAKTISLTLQHRSESKSYVSLTLHANQCDRRNEVHFQANGRTFTLPTPVLPKHLIFSNAVSCLVSRISNRTLLVDGDGDADFGLRVLEVLSAAHVDIVTRVFPPS